MRSVSGQYQNDAPEAAQPARVVLIQMTGLPETRDLEREVALALASRGCSLALWTEAEDREGLDREALLDLQLQLERAGGISLRVHSRRLAESGLPAEAPVNEGMALAVESFGRIDAALAWGEDGAARMARAMKGLGRPLRVERLLILLDSPQEENAPKAQREDLKDGRRALRWMEISNYCLGEDMEDPDVIRQKAQEIAEILIRN